MAALIILPIFVQGTYYRFLGIVIFIYGIVAVGLNILAGYAGQFSLGHAALMAVGAYTTALLTKALAPLPFFAATGLHIWFGLVAGTLVAAAFGALLAVPALRVRGPYLAMVTIAFGWVIFKVLQEWVSVTGGDLGLSSIPKAQLGRYLFDTGSFYYVVLGFFVATLMLQHRLVNSDFGLRIIAIKHSEIAVSAVGINVYRLKVLVFVISAAFAGFGGTLFAHQQNYVSPDNFQFFSSVFFLLAVLFGGAGTLMGPVVGAAVLTILPEILQEFDKFRLIIYGCFILLTLYFLPNGVMGLLAVRSIRAPGPEKGPTLVDATSPNKPAKIVGVGLQLNNIFKSFGGLQALRDVNLRVEPSTIHALIGPNGAGKTTLINVATGFYPLDSGEMVINGHTTTLRSMHDAARQGIVRTFQTIKLFGNMTVLEHVLVGCARHSRSGYFDAIMGRKSARDEAARNLANARELISFVGLARYENVPANSLAYGHRRLLEIARALAVRPQLLLLDEPAAGLVAEEIHTLGRIIRQLKASGITVVLVEHHMELVISISDRVTVLDYGVVIADGPPAAIQRDERVIAAYLGTPHAAA
ncbi:MAG TPA: branched-chain amino acid ABC transporter ATP-binding protein/permease [Xanthobacteraceae bacterium]|nr:branched-chain amino acid ABC transporter ATP-binding protein/permease [Xanthobacteraceae bacterium]